MAQLRGENELLKKASVEGSSSSTDDNATAGGSKNNCASNDDNHSNYRDSNIFKPTPTTNERDNGDNGDLRRDVDMAAPKNDKRDGEDDEADSSGRKSANSQHSTNNLESGNHRGRGVNSKKGN